MNTIATVLMILAGLCLIVEGVTGFKNSFNKDQTVYLAMNQGVEIVDGQRYIVTHGSNGTYSDPISDDTKVVAGKFHGVNIINRETYKGSVIVTIGMGHSGPEGNKNAKNL